MKKMYKWITCLRCLIIEFQKVLSSANQSLYAALFFLMMSCPRKDVKKTVGRAIKALLPYSLRACRRIFCSLKKSCFSKWPTLYLPSPFRIEVKTYCLLVISIRFLSSKIYFFLSGKVFYYFYKTFFSWTS